MNKSVFSMLAATALVGVATVPAHATGDGDGGRATATVLRTDLKVGLIDKSVNVPLTTTLNEVKAGGHGGDRAGKTALTVELDGVDKGKPFSMLHAKVADAKAVAEGGTASGSVKLVDARVHLPGLPGLGVIEADQVTSRATCTAGEKPTAEANVLGSVKVLGKKTELTAGGTTVVKVPELGEVRLELSKTHTTSHTAAASALELAVTVDPLKLNVAEVKGRIILAESKCSTPNGGHGGTSGGGDAGGSGGTGGDTGGGDAGADGGKDVGTQTVPGEKEEASQGSDGKSGGTSPDLAATGGSSSTPYIAGGAAVLIAAGGALALARRRRNPAGGGDQG